MSNIATATAALENVSILPARLCPWHENPYGLISWWDMQNFAGDDLFSALAILSKIECGMLHYKAPGDSAIAHLMGPIVLPVEERETIEQSLHFIESTLGSIGLTVTLEAIREFRTILINHKLPVFAKLSPAEAISRIQEIQRSCRREMSASLFLYVSPEQGRQYRELPDEWNRTIKRWPRILVDVEESLKCYALSRYGASVFHILLVAEFGVIQVAKLLGVAGDKPGWGALDRLEKILKKEYTQRSPLEQSHSELLQHLAPLLQSIKNSWRHKISHVENKLDWIESDFSPAAANRIITATCGLMDCIATELP